MAVIPIRTRKRTKTCSAAQIDALLELRADLRRLTAAERALSQEIKAEMLRAGVKALHGTRAVALLDDRQAMTPDPARFIEAVGQAGVSALRVDVKAARRLMAPAALAKISERSTSHVLRCEPIPTAGGAA